MKSEIFVLNKLKYLKFISFVSSANIILHWYQRVILDRHCLSQLCNKTNFHAKIILIVQGIHAHNVMFLNKKSIEEQSI